MGHNRTGDGGSDAVAGESEELRVALDWFVLFQGSEPTAEHRRAFRAWYDADARHREAYARVEAVWRAPELEYAARGVDREDTQREQQQSRGIGRRSMAVAAVVLLAVVGVGVAFDLPLRLRADHMTGTGERREIALPDGSTVLLDSASAIQTGIAGEVRRVDLLTGRARFEIASNPDRRFRVVTSQAVIEVTGTQFTVALGADGTRVTLREGSLQVGHRGQSDTMEPLAPGQRIRMNARGLAGKEPAAFPAANGWVEGRLIFRDRTLSSILDELRRYHAGTILVLDPELGKTRLSGNYKLDHPVRVVAQLAKLASADLFRLSDRVLVLH